MKFDTFYVKCFGKGNAITRFGKSTLPAPALPPAHQYDPEQPRNVVSYVMSREEEVRWFQEYNYAKYMIVKLCRGNIRILENSALANNWHKRVKHLEEYLTRLNLPLVYSQVARNRGRFGLLDWDEAVSEGQMALMRCIVRFDPTLGFKFSTYTVRSILSSLLSLSLRKKAKQERFPTVELSNLNDGEDIELDNVPEGADMEKLHTVLKTNKARLTTTERLVIMHRFGLSRAPQETLEVVGDRLGVSKERVRQIQVKALGKLRDVLATAN